MQREPAPLAAGCAARQLSGRSSSRDNAWFPSAVQEALKKIPKFRSENEERDFWAREDSTRYVDWSQAKRRKFPKLKPSLRTISIRLPVAMIADLKVLANKRDVPYQSLLKVFLAERLQQECRRA